MAYCLSHVQSAEVSRDNNRLNEAAAFISGARVPLLPRVYNGNSLIFSLHCTTLVFFSALAV